MAFLIWMLIGLLIGWIAQGLIRQRGDLAANLIIGLVGGLIGGFLFTHLSAAVRPNFFGSLGSAAAVAAVLVTIGALMRRR